MQRWNHDKNMVCSVLRGEIIIIVIIATIINNPTKQVREILCSQLLSKEKTSAARSPSPPGAASELRG